MITSPIDANEMARARIQRAANVLWRTERGVKVAEELRAFLNGAACSLDGPGWEAVRQLITWYRSGYRGSVLDSLDQARD